MKKVYEAPEMEKLILISESIMTNSGEENDNTTDIEDLLGDITTP